MKVFGSFPTISGQGFVLFRQPHGWNSLFIWEVFGRCVHVTTPVVTFAVLLLSYSESSLSLHNVCPIGYYMLLTLPKLKGLKPEPGSAYLVWVRNPSQAWKVTTNTVLLNNCNNLKYPLSNVYKSMHNWWYGTVGQLAIGLSMISEYRTRQAWLVSAGASLPRLVVADSWQGQ